MRISVIIPCFRAAATIRRALESVLIQTSAPQEIIVVDDCSGDSTLEVLNRISGGQTGVSIRVIALDRNVGPGGARNAGWGAARGEFIAFLDADDSWHARKLEIQHGWMAAHPEVRLTGHRVIQFRETDEFSQIPAHWGVKLVKRSGLLLSNYFPTSSVMVRRDVPFRFDPGKRYCEDYLLWLQIVLSGHAAYRIDLPLAAQYKAVYGAAGSSAHLWKMESGELDAYRQIHLKQLINLPTLALACMWSLVKYMRRLVVTLIRKLG